MKIDNQTALELPQQAICEELLREKYCLPGESSRHDIAARVAKGLAETPEQQSSFENALLTGFVPGGRINRSIGAGNSTTAINCFVQPVGDCMSGLDGEGRPGIMDALKQSAETMRRGGGVGYDFSEVRPVDARVKGTGGAASGPLSYMRVFDRMCATVMSAGSRRGAQMGILRIDHPDVLSFIDAKKGVDPVTMGLSDKSQKLLAQVLGESPKFFQAYREAFNPLVNFNISVAVTDEFMKAVMEDGCYDLVHREPSTRHDLPVKVCADGVQRFIYQTLRARDVWDRVMRNTYNGAEPGVVFIDTVNRLNNLRYCEQIVACNPCGEQFLAPYGACDLGSVMLSAVIDSPFTKSARINWNKLKSLVHVGVEMLDRVLDITTWPLPEQQIESQHKRPIGLGYTAVADAMAMCGVTYGSPESVKWMDQVAAFVAHEAYRASIKLAKRLGSFPYFDADEFLAEGTFASKLPADIQEAIRKDGIRNGRLLSIPPAGTISMAFGDNASSGVEPTYALVQKRSVKQADGSIKEIQLENAAYRRFRMMFGSNADESVFATALNLSVDEHLAVLGAVAPHVDNAISKTVNVPANYSFEDFSQVYLLAWKMGLKGITTYRPNDITGSVLEDARSLAATTAAELPKSDDPDRRIQLKSVNNIISELRWPDRPVVPGGNPSVTYSVEYPHGAHAIVVGHYQNGRKHPLEVYVCGNSQPRGLAAIAKSLSVDMRTGDAGWLTMKLDSLRNTEGDDGFEMVDPDSGLVVRAASLVSGFARYVTHALKQIDALDITSESKMIKALFSMREPKSGPSGTVSWSVDIANPATGDDFVMTVKEAAMPDGSVRPYSVWLSGRYPRVLDGWTKLLSIDMRVSDTGWALMKLKKLLKFGEQRGDFLAWVPGETRQQNYPSTVAYMAALLLERYRVLGFSTGTQSAVTVQAQTASESSAPGVGNGMLCPACGTNSLHKRDGCKTCDHCGHQGECG